MITPVYEALVVVFLLGRSRGTFLSVAIQNLYPFCRLLEQLQLPKICLASMKQALNEC